MKRSLAEIAARLETLATHGPPPPHPWERVARRLWRSLATRHAFEIEAIATLVRAPGPATLKAALEQLERRVSDVERLARVTGRTPIAQLNWLWRLYQILYRALQLLDEAPEVARQLLAASVECHQLHPLIDPTVPGFVPAATSVDPMLDAAGHEFRRLGRKRRLLEAARQLLLEAVAAGEVNSQAAQARRQAISAQLAQLDRLQAAGVSPDVDLLYQVREARAHRDLQRLTATLTALERTAAEGGQERLAQLAGQALQRLWAGTDRFSDSARAASLARSQQELFGKEARARIEAGYRRVTASLPKLREQWKDQLDALLFEHVQRYLAGDPTAATLAAATAVDGSFELGVSVSPARALEINQRLIAVRHPTQELTLTQARTVADLPDAVIEDPRTVIGALAAGTLLTRRYLALEDVPVEKPGLRNDARFYVLDGSGSMLGPRSRMRDALLINELVTLAARLQDPRRAGHPVLYYCYFNEEVGPVVRVRTAAEAHQAIEDVIATVQSGGTNIQKALGTAFEQLRKARESDPDLVRAQIVLVTDGEADVDAPALEAARAAVGEVPIGVSIVALGQQNRALRELAASQRARGERVFYQFMDDGELADVERGRTAGLPIHLPALQAGAALSEELGAVMNEIEQYGRRMEVPDREYASVLEAAMVELGLSPAADLTEAARARHEVLIKDEATLCNRFLRWFPLPGTEPPAPLDARDGEPLEELGRLVDTVAEVIEMGHAHPLEQRADSIEMMERLLRSSGIAPWRYADLLRRHGVRLEKPLRRLHAAVGGLDAG
jgi:hypothetical protein